MNIKKLLDKKLQEIRKKKKLTQEYVAEYVGIETSSISNIENGKYYISDTFELFKDNIINGNVSRDVFQSVYTYFHDVISDENSDFTDEKEELINFMVLTEEYDENQLRIDLDSDKIRRDYQDDHDRIYSDDSLNMVQKSLALKELLHMSICQVVNDIDLFFTRPYDLTPEENAEKNRQEAKAFENEVQLG